MITALVFVLAQAAAARPTPTPSPSPAPKPASALAKLSGGFGAKPGATPALGKARVAVTDDTVAQPGQAGGRGSFSVAGAPIAEPSSLELAATQLNAAMKAQERQTRAIDHAIWTAENIHYNAGIRDEARAGWETAAEECRKTPGCKPIYRPKHVLPTPEETGEMLRQSISRPQR